MDSYRGESKFYVFILLKKWYIIDDNFCFGKNYSPTLKSIKCMDNLVIYSIQLKKVTQCYTYSPLSCAVLMYGVKGKGGYSWLKYSILEQEEEKAL